MDDAKEEGRKRRRHKRSTAASTNDEIKTSRQEKNETISLD